MYNSTGFQGPLLVLPYPLSFLHRNNFYVIFLVLSVVLPVWALLFSLCFSHCFICVTCIIPLYFCNYHRCYRIRITRLL
jgi:hypothetical protein